VETYKGLAFGRGEGSNFLQPSVSYFGSPVVQRYLQELVGLKSCRLALSPFDVTSRSSLGFLRHEPVDGSLGHPTNLYYFSAKDRVPAKLCPLKWLSRLEPTKATRLAWLPSSPSAFSASVAPISSPFQASKEKPFSLEDPCVGFGYPFHETRIACLKNLFQFSTLLGFNSSELLSGLLVSPDFSGSITHALSTKTFRPPRCASAHSRSQAVSSAT